MRNVVAIMVAVLLSGHAVAQTPPRPAPAPPTPPKPAPETARPTDFLQAVNETTGTATLELFDAGEATPGKRPRMYACLKRGESVRWRIDRDTPRGEIRLQVMQGDRCEEPPRIACEHVIDRAPGLRYVALRGEGRKCGVFAMPGPAAGTLQASEFCGFPWSPLTIDNQSDTAAAWVTKYDEAGQILYAACWLPLEKRMACVERRKLRIRVQLTRDPSRGPGARAQSCSEPVICDTEWAYWLREATKFTVFMEKWSSYGYQLTLLPLVGYNPCVRFVGVGR